MRTYIAGLESKRVEVQAASLYEAKQKAAAVLKPTKRNAGLLWVVLCESALSEDEANGYDARTYRTNLGDLL
jgi:hypothetical protein